MTQRARPATAALSVRPRRALSMRELAAELGHAGHSREVQAWLEALGAPLLYGNKGQAILIEEDDLEAFRERLEALVAQAQERVAAKSA